MKRPQFTLSNLLLLMVIVSMSFMTRFWYEQARVTEEKLMKEQQRADAAQQRATRAQELALQQARDDIAEAFAFWKKCATEAMATNRSLRQELYQYQQRGGPIEAPPVAAD